MKLKRNALKNAFCWIFDKKEYLLFIYGTEKNSIIEKWNNTEKLFAENFKYVKL